VSPLHGLGQGFESLFAHYREVSEWFKELAWNASKPERVSEVRILSSLLNGYRFLIPISFYEIPESDHSYPRSFII
jgi:hypothetical protein